MEPVNTKTTTLLLKKIGNELADKRALLVDRHASARGSIRSMLANIGITSISNASSCSEVLRRVQSEHCDIIIADYQLDDGRDGHQLLEELKKKHFIQRSTVYMVVTAERNYHNVIAVAELIPDSYLIKPFTADQLQHRLVRAFYKKLFFRQVLEYLDSRFYTEALAACEKLIGKEAIFYYDALRYKGEILNILGRFEEALAVYQHVSKTIKLPWAKKGLAVALRGLGKIDEAETLGVTLVKESPRYLAAYDFVASIREETGELTGAQDILQKASLISPKNLERLEAIGDVAIRNNDLETAERAYTKVLESRRDSLLKKIDDYTNLSRVFLNRGRIEAARKVGQELMRDWRENKHGELAALIIESLCEGQAGESAKARSALEKAMSLRENLIQEDDEPISQKIMIDLAHACLNIGEEDLAEEILGQVAAENHENRGMIAHIQDVFLKAGKEKAGQTLLAKVGREIVELNNKGVMAARSGDLESSVQILTETAEQVPNLQFLVNAAKAIFTLLDRDGWDEELAHRGIRYLRMAQERAPGNVKVISASELYHQVVRKSGDYSWMENENMQTEDI